MSQDCAALRASGSVTCPYCGRVIEVKAHPRAVEVAVGVDVVTVIRAEFLSLHRCDG